MYQNDIVPAIDRRSAMTILGTVLVTALFLLGAAPSASAQFIDLVITSGTPAATPTQVEAGETVTLSGWTVRNNGNVRAGGFHNGFYLSSDAVITSADLYLDGNSNSGLNPGQSFTWGGPTLTIPASVNPGIYYIGILVDRSGEVAEINEGNNYVRRQITVSGCPDVFAYNLAILQGTQVYPGEKIGHRLRAMAQNIGEVDADSFFVGFYLSSDAIITRSDRLLIGGREYIYHLTPGQTQSVSIYDSMQVPTNYPTGYAYLGVIFDELGDVAECNENNNTRSLRVYVASPPADLIVSSGTPTVTPTELEPGQSFAVSAWSVRNQGGTASGQFRNGFYLSTDAVITATDQYLGGNANSGLDPGASWNWGGPTLTIPAATTPGVYYVGILVDRESVVIESNENNNYASRQIRVTSCPDARIASFTISNGSTVRPDEAIGYRLAALAENIGGAPADSMFVGFYLSSDANITTSDRLLIGGREYIYNLPAGASAAVSIYDSMRVPDNYPTGSAYLGVIVDEFDDVVECNEANNTRAIAITVSAGRADLHITTSPFIATPQVVQAGGLITLPAYTIANTGTEGASGFRNGFFFSTDSNITTADTYITDNYNSFVSAGGTFNWGGPTLPVPAGTASGVYYMGILVDMDGDVAESNESNNYVCARVVVEIATEVEEREGDGLPTSFVLSQNYPNPFNPATVIEFSLPAAAHANLIIYNVLGREVATLVNENLPAGSYSVEWNGQEDSGSPAASGIYFFGSTMKMVLVK